MVLRGVEKSILLIVHTLLISIKKNKLPAKVVDLDRENILNHNFLIWIADLDCYQDSGSQYLKLGFGSVHTEESQLK